MPFLREKSGKFSPEKMAAFAAAMAPLFWLLWRTFSGDLGSRPVTEAIHFTGDWTVRFLLMTLAITPLRRVLALPRLILARRTLGVTACAYAAIHLSLYVVDQKFALGTVASEIVMRFYLTIGAVALAGLITLASTSWDGAVRRLGSARWNALHRVVYGIAVLAIIHFTLQSKLNVYEPMLMAGFLFWLLLYRVGHRFAGPMTPARLVILAIASAFLAGATELAWYALATGIDARRFLPAFLAFRAEIRPAWWVLAAGLAMAVAAWLRMPAQRTRRERSSIAASAPIQVQSRN